MKADLLTIDVSVPFNEIFEGYCHKCGLQSNDITLFDYTNEEPVCLNCKKDKVEEVSDES